MQASTFFAVLLGISGAFGEPNTADNEVYNADKRWDPVSRVCPQNDSDVLVTLPHETDCDKFYVCIDGDLVLEDCPEGLHFDPKYGACDWPAIVNCQLTSPRPPTTTNKPSSTSTSRPTTISTTSKPNPPNECPKDNNGGVLITLPHETDCDKFYVCTDGDKVLNQCPEGLHFAPEYGACDWPPLVNCQLTSPNPSSTTSVPSTTSTTLRPITSSERPSSSSSPKPTSSEKPSSSTSKPSNPKECPKDNNGGILVTLPHETDCDKFYACIDGDKVIRVCPEGLHFDPEYGVCDWPSIVNCQLTSPIPSSTTQRPLPTSTSLRPTTSTQKPSSSSTTSKPSTTSEIPSTTSTTLRPTTSSQRPTTSSQRPTTSSQRPTTSSQRPSTSTSTSKPTTTSEKPAPSSSTSRPTTSSEKPSSSSERPSTSTSTSKPTTTSEKPVASSSTPRPTTSQKPSSSTSRPSHPTECPKDNNSGVLVTLPHETDCDKFYVCIDGDRVMEICPEGLHYNPEDGTCDWPSIVNCQLTSPIPSSTTQRPRPTSTSLKPTTSTEKPSSSSTTSKPSTTSEKPSTTSTTLRPTTSSQRPSSSSSPRPTTSSERPSSSTSGPSYPFDCPDDNNGGVLVTYPHETDCDKFYVCVDGDVALQECPEGLHYNPANGACDWPSVANCWLTSPRPSTTTKRPSPTRTTPRPTTTSERPSSSSSTSKPTTASEKPVTSSSTPRPTTSSEKPTSSSTLKPSYPTSCPKEDWEIPVVLPHECVCTKYYVCVEGRQVLEICPSGLHFNPSIHDCDLPENAGCVKPTTTISPPTGCPQWGSTEEAVHVAHETNCSLFYTCVNGGKVIQECPNGLHFNPDVQVCDWPWNVNCIDKVLNLRKPSSLHHKHINKREIDSNDGSSSTMRTTTPAWMNPITCVGWCPLVDPLNYTVQLPNEICSNFCKCSNGRAIVIPCPENLHYSVELGVCTWPADAKCIGIGGVPPAIPDPVSTSEISSEDNKNNVKEKAPPSFFGRMLKLW